MHISQNLSSDAHQTTPQLLRQLLYPSTPHIKNLDFDTALGDGVSVDAPTEPSFHCLPDLDKTNVDDNTASDDTPLPSKTLMLEDFGVEVRDVHDGEDHDEASDNGPEEELVVVDGSEHGEGARGTLIHVEQTAMEMLDLPGCHQQQEGQGGKGRGTGSVYEVTSLGSALIAVGDHVIVTLARRRVVDDHESSQAKGT